MKRSKNIYYNKEHPCTDGHFPGNPIIPGAVLLSEIASFTETTLRKRLTDIPKVKFAAPLRPDESAQLTIEERGTSLLFNITKGETTILSGKAKLETPK